VRESDERPTDVSAAVGVEETTAVTNERLGPGTEIGGYMVDGELGHGGMGIVYSATHPLIGKRAAIKVLKPELSKEPAAVDRFIREARAVNQIGHPNIVDIYDFGQLPDGRSYYLMDLLTGESLRTRLKRGGALHVSEAASVIDETASALAAAHTKGIIHRDLKPDNVFMVNVMGRWPEVKILDWGLAKLVRGGGKFQTVTGSVLGTPVYMSPEQARGEQVDFRTDIYALGVMSYELLTGAVPFRGKSSVDTLLAHQEEPVPPLQPRVPTLPEELTQLIEAMLAKTADDRPTLAAVRAVLKRLRGTKIPTMTAAGLPLPGPISTERTAVRGEPGPLSMELTVPRLPSQQAPPQPGPASAQIDALPPPPTYPPPMGRASTNPPYDGRSPTNPPYPYTPGHSFAPPPAYGPAYAPQVGYPPSAYPNGSIPPSPQFPSAAGLLPPRAATAQPASPGPRRWVVIVIAAVVASAIRVALALAL
jgi:serine/threonine protein kinase